MSRYQVIAATGSTELEIKKSRFIGHVEQTANRNEAMAFIARIKAEHHQANHNCWAFQAGPPGTSREIGCSDDGEPHGTAGKPILNVVMHADVGELTVIVTRYFGGVKLGTGGLARAYTETAKQVIEEAQKIEKLEFENISLEIEYNQWSLVEVLLKDVGAVEISPAFDQKIKITAAIDQTLLQEFNRKYQNITLGKGKFVVHN